MERLGLGSDSALNPCLIQARTTVGVRTGRLHPRVRSGVDPRSLHIKTARTRANPSTQRGRKILGHEPPRSSYTEALDEFP